MALVSAVITTHKREPKIVERALKSVLNQTYKDIEVIVVDDSPSSYELRDSVKTMVENYADKGVTYIAHETCQGACVARNTGLYNAKGEFIAYLDDDDEWKPEKIERQIEKFNKESVALVYCGAESIFESENKTVKWNQLFLRGMIYSELLKENFIGSTSFPLIRKQALVAVGGFDKEMQSAQDYDVWLRLTQKYEVDFVEDSLVVYHVHEGEQITKNVKKKISGLERIILKNKEHIHKNRKLFWIRYSCLIPFYAKDGQKKKAFKIWFRCCLKCPWKIKGNLKNLYGFLRNLKGCKK